MSKNSIYKELSAQHLEICIKCKFRHRDIFRTNNNIDEDIILFAKLCGEKYNTDSKCPFILEHMVIEDA